MTDKIICPWCGARMSYRQLDHINGFYNCPQCLASGPAGRGEAGARESALRRYTPPIKPMTFEEVERIVRSDNIDDETPLYLEDVYGRNCWEISYKMTYMCRALKDDYGKTWRCWSRKPTDEERSAAGWET